MARCVGCSREKLYECRCGDLYCSHCGFSGEAYRGPWPSRISEEHRLYYQCCASCGVGYAQEVIWEDKAREIDRLLSENSRLQEENKYLQTEVLKLIGGDVKPDR